MHVAVYESRGNIAIQWFTARTGHDLSTVDDLVLHLPLREVVQDLHSTGATQDACARSCTILRVPPGKSERDHTSIANGTSLKYLDNKVGIDCASEGWNG